MWSLSHNGTIAVAVGPCIVKLLSEPICWYTQGYLEEAHHPKNNNCVNMTTPRPVQAACVSDAPVDVDKRFTIAHNFMRRRKLRAFPGCLLTSLSEGQYGFSKCSFKFAEFLAGSLNTWKHSHPNNHWSLRRLPWLGWVPAVYASVGVF